MTMMVALMLLQLGGSLLWLLVSLELAVIYTMMTLTIWESWADSMLDN